MTTAQQLQVLFLEDRPADAELAMRELRKAGLQFVAKCVATEADFLASLRDGPPDLILADYSLPAYDGLSALAFVQKECPHIPFIFVSGTMGEETAIEALHQGATDYVLKQRLTRLGPAARRALRETEDRAQRRQAEASLRASERSYHEIFNAANDAIFLHDAASGAILEVNQTALDMFGYAREELFNLPGDQFRADTAFSHQEAVRRIRQAAAAGPQVFEWQSKRKNGESFWTEVALRGAHIGGQERVLAIVRDITERKRDEIALSESRRLLKAILDNIPDPAWLKDLQGRFLAVNEPLAQLYGRKVKDILGKTVFETVPSEAERLAREDHEAITSRKPIRVERPFTDARGQRRWFDTIKSPIFNERGEVTGTVGIARETTERRQTDEALRVSEERFRSVWEHSIDGMRLTDREGRILAVNEAFCRLVKLPREKLIGQVFGVAYVEHGPDEVEVYRRGFEAGTFAPRLTSHLRLWNAEDLDVEVSSSFVESDRHSKTLLSIFRDVRERKRAEEREAAFSHLGQQLSAAMNAREAGDIIVAAADQLLGWDACTLDLYSPEKDRLHYVLNRDTINGQRVDFPSDYPYGLPNSHERQAIETGGELILKEGAPVMLPSTRPFGDIARPSASIMLVPARAGAEVVAVLSIHSYTPKAYDQRGLATLQLLADHCAGALKRIRAQEALNTSEANYRSLVERSPDAIFLHQDGKFVYANPATLKLLGAEKHQQLLGRRVFDIVPPQNHDLVRQRIRQVAEGETSPPLEQKILRLDGTAIDVEVTGIPFTYEGQPAVQTVMRDITGRKRAETALRESETRFRTLVEYIPQKIFVKDRNSRWVSVNENFAREFGLGPEEVVGKTDYDFFPTELADKYRADDERIMRTGQTEELEEKHIQDGSEIWVNVVKSPVRNERGEITGVFGIFWDITERRKLEEQLRQSQKMEAIGQLAGGVAHDFNNLLAVIRGNAELLLMDADQHSSATRECLKQVTAASERAANLTRQLLAFSRKQVMQSRPLVLNDVVADLTKMLRRIIGEHIDLQCRYAAQLPFVQADAGMIEQILVNLAVNARDAMPHGGQLLITTEPASLDAATPLAHPEARAGQFVCLMVKDAGTGIAPEHLPRIFEPFFTTKELGKGTGLGLAMVYGIVKQHQGWIEVFSSPGAGATFRIFLPATPTPARTSATPQPEADLPGGTETILLVEDDYAVRMITRRVLESHGYKICEATTASEALDLWRSRAQEITLLLTDIVMPQGVTGRDLAEQLRAHRPALKVIFMSGYSADVIGKDTDFFRRTSSSFLQKPCSARTILETVRRCLDEK